MSATEFTVAWRAVATAKVSEFCYQADRLADLALAGIVDCADAADVLHDIAEAHSLGDTFGADCINEIIAEAFEGAAAAQVEAAQ